VLRRKRKPQAQRLKKGTNLDDATANIKAMSIESKSPDEIDF